MKKENSIHENSDQGVLTPWNNDITTHSDHLKRFVYQCQEETLAQSLPHVITPFPPKKGVSGSSSPHQTGDLVCYDLLTRAPLFDLTCHFSSIPPTAPIRGAHRHIPAPTLFCLSGKGWEWNDGNTYLFEAYDLLVVPPFTIHQHGCDKEIGCEIYVPQTRLAHTLALLGREQIKFSETPTFPEGTEPIYDEPGKLIGYRIKKGVLGVTKDIEVFLGGEPDKEACFQARRSAGPWDKTVESTYDRYLKLLHDEVYFCKNVTHVVKFEEQSWELTRQGRLKWLVHPDIVVSARRVWLYLQEIPEGSRSGKHRHSAEEQILVMQGRGYDVHDGERWNWQKGDLINIPPMTTHQHFNTAADGSVLLISSMPCLNTDLGLGGIEQIENAPEFMERSDT